MTEQLDDPPIQQASDAPAGVHLYRLVGYDPGRAMENGCRLLCVHPMTSDLPLRGAMAVSEPFFRAAERCGF